METPEEGFIMFKKHFARYAAFSLGLALLAQPGALAQTFPDVPSGNWYSNFVSFLAERNVVSGYPDGSFRPHNPVTRAEFATMLAEAQQLPNNPVSSTRFSDVPGGHWASGSVEAAASRGWISGYPDGSFGPNRQITMAEMYTIASKILPGTVDATTAKNLLEKFSDGSAVPGWAQTAVATALSNGTYVSEVTPQSIDPFSIAQRADVSTVIAKVLNTPFRTPVEVVATNPDPVEPDPTPITFRGVLQPTVEAGGWVVVDEDTDEKYLLLDIPANRQSANWFRAGTIVTVTGVPDDDAVTIYMEGRPIDVTDIRRIPRTAGAGALE
jgi:hypothetical protein